MLDARSAVSALCEVSHKPRSRHAEPAAGKFQGRPTQLYRPRLTGPDMPVRELFGTDELENSTHEFKDRKHAESPWSGSHTGSPWEESHTWLMSDRTKCVIFGETENRTIPSEKSGLRLRLNRSLRFFRTMKDSAEPQTEFSPLRCQRLLADLHAPRAVRAG